MKVASITRLPPYEHHVPVFKLGRFHLIGPYRMGPNGNGAPAALFAYTLEEAADFLAKGYPLLMGKPGAWWGSFVEAKGLSIVFDGDDV